MRCIAVHNLSDLKCLEPNWQAWASSPMQSPQWMLAWWDQFRTQNSQLCVLVVYDETQNPIGLAPFFIRESWSLGRSLRFLGSGRACGDFQSLLAAPGQLQLVAHSVASWLVDAQRSGTWSFLELEGTTLGDATIDTLVGELKAKGCSIQTTELEHTWRLDLTQGLTGFLQGLSKTQRQQTRNLLNRFDKLTDVQLTCIDDSEQIQRELGTCIELHQMRWNAAGQSGCFADSRFDNFIRTACTQLALRGQIQVAVLRINGEPVASHLYLRDATGNLFLYQSGRDPLRERDGVGKMLNAAMVRTAVESGVQFIDYLRGDEIYKHRLGAIASKNLRTRIAAPSWLPQLRNGIWTLGRELKRGFSTLSQKRRDRQLPADSNRPCQIDSAQSSRETDERKSSIAQQ